MRVCVCGFVRDVSISIKTIERPAKEEREGEEERGIEKISSLPFLVIISPCEDEGKREMG